ncbi:MAG: hypothetical protein K9L56_15205 [Clostridiales bacterium]|nr:hypothetical protein [Clostridiales bacterium]
MTCEHCAPPLDEAFHAEIGDALREAVAIDYSTDPPPPLSREIGAHVNEIMPDSAREDMAETISDRMTARYEDHARRFQEQIGADPDFSLTAEWKRKKLEQQARKMADSLSSTLRKRAAAIDASDMTLDERIAAKKKLIEYKTRQLQEIVENETNLQAQSDQLVHSRREPHGGGLVDPAKDEIMYFRNLGPNTCDICIGINAGNPYTVQQATTLGGSAHPNCLCEWEMSWAVDEKKMNELQSAYSSGDIQMWDGSSRTPRTGSATARQSRYMGVRKGGWKGRRIQQKINRTRRERNA